MSSRQNPSGRIAGHLVEIRTGFLPNEISESNRCVEVADHSSFCSNVHFKAEIVAVRLVFTDFKANVNIAF